MLSDWSVTLARAIAPDEAALAPLVTSAFVAGGKSRAELFKPAAKNVPGAFGAGALAVSVFPMALQVLAHAGPATAALLASPLILGVLECCRTALTLAEVKHHVHAMQLAKGEAETAGDGQLDMLRHALDQIPAELEACGLGAEKCSETTLRILRVLVADPKAASAAITELAQAKT